MDFDSLYEAKYEVEEAVDKAFELAKSYSPANMRLFLAFGDYYEIFENTSVSPYVIDNVDDFRYDKNRIDFLTRYLQGHYEKPAFSYQGSDGIDCITIELMIYSQLWESDFFLKILARLASLSIGGDYLWRPFQDEAPKKKGSNWNWIQQSVVHPLLENDVLLGKLINDCYCSNLRNSFAHSIYDINEQFREIRYFSFNRPIQKRKRLLYPEKSHKISFDDFQVIFLKAAHLSYYVNACISQCRDSELDKIDSVEIINLPNGEKAGVTVFREFDVNRFGLEIYPS